MICGGTGIAPFLSFLEERQRVSEESGDPMGEAVLYYGCRNSTEYMFRTRLTSYLRGPDGRQGVLDRLVVCFSCSSELDNNGYTEKLQSSQEGEEVIREVLNITDIVTRQTPLLVPLMRNHARIYVCGGAGNFGNAVRGSVEALVRKSYSLEEIGVSDKEDSTSHYGVRHLVAQRRYFEDLAD
ncbi:MTRR [Symbiodinium microadriaticum]|nr:MTRR [Symbiodinium microadriaticum]